MNAQPTNIKHKKQTTYYSKHHKLLCSWQALYCIKCQFRASFW
jgi:hypothetical protein